MVELRRDMLKSRGHLSLNVLEWQHFLSALDSAYLSEIPIQIKAAYPSRTEFNGERKMLPFQRVKG